MAIQSPLKQSTGTLPCFQSTLMKMKSDQQIDNLKRKTKQFRHDSFKIVWLKSAKVLLRKRYQVVASETQDFISESLFDQLHPGILTLTQLHSHQGEELPKSIMNSNLTRTWKPNHRHVTSTHLRGGLFCCGKIQL